MSFINRLVFKFSRNFVLRAVIRPSLHGKFCSINLIRILTAYSVAFIYSFKIRSGWTENAGEICELWQRYIFVPWILSSFSFEDFDIEVEDLEINFCDVLRISQSTFNCLKTLTARSSIIRNCSEIPILFSVTKQKAMLVILLRCFL